MPSQIDQPKYWRLRAEETRAIADSMTNTKTIETLNKIARDYEALARMADEREELRRKIGGDGEA